MRFFFYGTLLDGSDNPVAREIHAKLEPEGPAVARGSLYAIPSPEGWFPALLPGPSPVHGFVYRATDRFTAEDLLRMDVYEDCDPANLAVSLYRREEMGVRLAGGESVFAQAYHYNQPLPEGASEIAKGDFRAWLAEAGVSAFGGTRAS